MFWTILVLAPFGLSCCASSILNTKSASFIKVATGRNVVSFSSQDNIDSDLECALACSQSQIACIRFKWSSNQCHLFCDPISGVESIPLSHPTDLKAYRALKYDVPSCIGRSGFYVVVDAHDTDNLDCLAPVIDPMTFYDADKYCASKCATLAFASDGNKVDAILTAFSNAYGQRDMDLLLGAKYDKVMDKWLGAAPGEEFARDSPMWNGNPPDLDQVQEGHQCVAVDVNRLYFKSIPCDTEKMAFACELTEFTLRRP